MTVSEYLEFWYNEYCIKQLEKSTYESYKRNIDKHIIWIYKTVFLDKVFNNSSYNRCNSKPKVISERLGHSTIGITMDIYSHIYDSTNEEIATNFDKFLKAN